MMSSPLTHLYDFGIPNALHLLGILLLAAIGNRLLRGVTNKLVKTAATQSRVAQQREQQTRARSETIYSVGSKAIWLIAALTALPEFGISALPAVAVTALAILGVGFGAHKTVGDVVAGFHIVFEDQFAPGDTIQAGETTGRVEQITLRRTVVRDTRGALVSLANGELRAVSNLSRDWAQAFVDISLPAGTPLERPLQALEAAAAELRGDAAWSQALVDGPRVLGVQSYDPAGVTLRLQVRTAPTRQDEVCRELRRRIHLEFQRQGIAASSGRAAESTAKPLT